MLSAVDRCRCKNGHRKHICLKEIGLRGQNLYTILGLIVNIIEKIYVTS